MGAATQHRQAFLKPHSICAFCGGKNAATTIEHCPPRAMFEYRSLPEGFEFPSCDGLQSWHRRCRCVGRCAGQNRSIPQQRRSGWQDTWPNGDGQQAVFRDVREDDADCYRGPPQKPRAWYCACTEAIAPGGRGSESDGGYAPGGLRIWTQTCEGGFLPRRADGVPERRLHADELISER